MSYSQYYPYYSHIEGGHRVLYGDSIVRRIKVLIIKVPCFFGQPRILTVAHMVSLPHIREQMNETRDL